MARPPAHTDAVLPIVALVRGAVTASGLSLRDYAAERGISYSTLRRYYDRRLPALSQPPRKETLRALALALDVPLREVEQAAVESLSYREQPVKLEHGEQEPAPSVEAAILADPRLLPEAKRHLVSQYGLLLRIAHKPIGPDHAPIAPLDLDQAKAQARISAHQDAERRADGPLGGSVPRDTQKRR